MRKLATIVNVEDVVPINGADKIELAKVRGWRCVVGKEQFKKGDVAVYMEVDSILPLEQRYEFLRKSSYKKTEWCEGFRIKTMNFLKCLSQGVLMPLQDFPELAGYSIGEDVTEKLKIVKYDPPVAPHLAGTVKGSFPSCCRISDMERIQNCPHLWNELMELVFEVSEKVDGCSGTYFYNDKQFGVCSRNLELCFDEKNTYWRMSLKYGIESAMARYFDKTGHNIAIQGEILGEGIQSNKLGIKGHCMKVFDIYSIDKKRYLDFDERRQNFDLLLSMQDSFVTTFEHVPILAIEKVLKKCGDIDAVLKYAEGNSIINTSRRREGLAFKSQMYTNSWGEMVTSFKAINNKDLLDEKD